MERYLSMANTYHRGGRFVDFRIAQVETNRLTAKQCDLSLLTNMECEPIQTFLLRKFSMFWIKGLMSLASYSDLRLSISFSDPNPLSILQCLLPESDKPSYVRPPCGSSHNCQRSPQPIRQLSRLPLVL